MKNNKKSKKTGIVFIIVGAVIMLAGAALFGYNIILQNKAEESSRQVLEEMTALLEKNSSAEGEDQGDSEPPETGELPTITIDGYDYIGRIDIPSLRLSLPVMSEWDYARLKISPCRFIGSVYSDDMIICAHNFSRHFGQIKNLSEGDVVIFSDINGKMFLYRVMEIQTINPTALEEMTGGDWDLSLFTCTIGGKARVTVRCEKIEK